MKNLIKGCVVFAVVMVILAFTLDATYGQQRVIDRCHPGFPVCTYGGSSVVAPNTWAEFSAEGSYDTNSGGKITKIDWIHVKPNGTEEPLSSTIPPIWTNGFTALEIGTHKMKIRVQNNYGLWSSWTECPCLTVEKPNEPPEATCELVSQSSKDAPSDVEVSAMKSKDSDGSIKNVRIDFGDKYKPEVVYGWNALHTYTAPGDYIITVTVTDDDGATDVSYCNISLGQEPLYCYGDYESELIYFQAIPQPWYKVNGKWRRDVLVKWKEKDPKREERWDGFWSLRGNGYYEPEKPNIYYPDRPQFMKELLRVTAGKGVYSVLIKNVPQNSDRNFVLISHCGCGLEKIKLFGSPEGYTDRPPKK